MTLRTILTTTAMAASALIAAPAFADGHAEHDMKAKVKAEADITMGSPAAKATLQQQKAEDLMQKAEQQMDAGMEDKAVDTAVDGIVMEMKAESNVAKAEAMTGADLVLKTKGETRDPLLGENATVLVNADTPETVTVPVTATITAPAPAVSISCPAGTTAQPDNTCMITGDYQE